LGSGLLGREHPTLIRVPLCPTPNAKMPKYKLVMFDSDGTLADTLPWMESALQKLMAQHGIPPFSVQDALALRKLSTAAMLRRMQIPMWKVPGMVAGMRRVMAENIHRFVLFDGIAEVLKGLAAGGITLGIVSSNSRANVEHILGPGTAALVRHYACGASVFGKAGKLRAVLKAAKVAPRDAIYIGDEVRDAEAAHKAGVAFGGVGWGVHSLDVLRDHSPAELFSQPSELSQLMS